VPDAAVRLIDLPVHTVARLHETRLDADARQGLEALGLTAASSLRVCQSGEPCIVQVRATRIGLSGAVAREIYVIPDGTAV
jgi:Fe2+ transport system protein FeoA